MNRSNVIPFGPRSVEEPSRIAPRGTAPYSRSVPPIDPKMLARVMGENASAPLAGSSPPHIADNDPSPENGCEKSPALFEVLYLLAGAIAGLVVLTWAVR